MLTLAQMNCTFKLCGEIYVVNPQYMLNDKSPFFKGVPPRASGPLVHKFRLVTEMGV